MDSVPGSAEQALAAGATAASGGHAAGRSPAAPGWTANRIAKLIAIRTTEK